jgi:hypothetical protein
MKAYGSLDADQTIRYLADDATISPLIAWIGAPPVEGTAALRLSMAWLDATGFEMTLHSCTATSSAAFGDMIRCTYGQHLLRSHEIGAGRTVLRTSTSPCATAKSSGSLLSTSTTWRHSTARRGNHSPSGCRRHVRRTPPGCTSTTRTGSPDSHRHRSDSGGATRSAGWRRFPDEHKPDLSAPRPAAPTAAGCAQARSRRTGLHLASGLRSIL